LSVVYQKVTMKHNHSWGYAFTCVGDWQMLDYLDKCPYIFY
jgi:hypothetical protein